MIKIDEEKLELVRQYHSQMADREIRSSIQDDGVELKADDIEAIKNKHLFDAEKKINEIRSLGPKKLHKMELTVGDGWRAGYTKETVEKKTMKRRKANKIARKNRKTNRMNRKK